MGIGGIIALVIGGLGGVAVVVLVTALVCFLMTFHAPARKPPAEGTYDFPKGAVYEPFHAAMKDWTDDIRQRPHESVSIISHDGLTLRGKLYIYTPDAPVELMMHGYKGNAERDLCGGVARAFAMGHSVLIPNHRASGDSDGHVITFGILEHRDCLRWIDFLRERHGETHPLILSGVSMGAATVMMAGGCDLPPNVRYILADCGYSSQKEIIRKVIREKGLPAGLLYPFVKLGARLYGGFDLEATSPMEAIRRCRVPVIFAHGDADGFVPCDMSRALFEACPTPKRLIIIPGADHGLCYPAAPEAYIEALKDAERAFGKID